MQTQPTTSKISDLDKKYVWHPFTQMQDWLAEDPLVIARAEGSYLIDTEGRRYIDGVSSLWCNVHGHRREGIDRAIKEQIDKVSHTTFLGLSNVPATLLAEKLIKITPEGLTKVFYSDSGSEAVEVALKMAYQFWHQKENPESKRTKFLHLENSYHGDTIGSVSVGGIDLFHKIYRSLLFESLAAPCPYCYRCPMGKEKISCKMECFNKLVEIAEANKDELAAIVIEPLMQGAAGMIDQPAEYISKARELADKLGTLLIFDEVATGFGRTGKMFASQMENVTPDILCVGKGITGGYLPLSATITTDKIFNTFLGDFSKKKTFFHGHTYTGNPLAAAAANATLDVFEKDKTLERLASKIKFLEKRLESLKALNNVGDIRQVGFMVGIELVKDKKTRQVFDWNERVGHKVIMKARERGVIIRPLGDVIILMPPLSISENELKELIDVVEWAIDSV